ncbi:MAG: ParB/RepB/Spo0J family partition protein [Eubacterium sp.]|nr:ParB/RepB/Spo0J family partition protein [Eubacterium sp.]
MSKIDNNKIKISDLEYLYDNGNLSNSDTLRNIPLKELFTFRDHPFLVVDDEKMAETVESIRKYGVLNPGIARPRKGGGYELISGHRRKRALEILGEKTMPVFVRNYTDDEAIIIMVDSNIQREKIRPSERAKAYRMRYEAMKRDKRRGQGRTVVVEMLLRFCYPLESNIDT